MYFKKSIPFIITIFLLIFFSCNKKKKEDEVVPSDTIKNKKEYIIPNNFTIASLDFIDSSNNMKYNILYPVSNDKENKISTKPINGCISEQIKKYIRLSKRNLQKNQNVLYIKPLYLNVEKDLISYIMKTTFIINDKNSTIEYKSINYLRSNNKILNLNDIVLNKDTHQFILCFDSSLSEIRDINNICFNIEKDSIAIMIDNVLYKQSRTKLNQYLNKELFND